MEVGLQSRCYEEDTLSRIVAWVFTVRCQNVANLWYEQT